MTARNAPLTERRAWKALAAHYEQVQGLHLRQLFATDPTRGERLSAEAVGLYLDYSKNRITDDTLRLLLQLAQECDLRAGIDIDALAAQLQEEGAKSFVNSWHDLMEVIASKSAALQKAS